MSLKNIVSFSILLSLLVSPSLYAMLSNSDNDQILHAVAYNDGICIAESTENSINLLTKYALKESILRRSLRTINYVEKFGTFLVSSALSTWTHSLLPKSIAYDVYVLPLLIVFDGIITNSFRYTQNSYYNIFPLGGGERIIRGERFDNLIDLNQIYELSGTSYNRIIDLIPTRTATTKHKCSLSLFEVGNTVSM